MEENFENIVRKYYRQLREPFMRQLTLRYPAMSLGTAEDLYQETFMAVQENIKKGRVRENTNWYSYILTIGFKRASKTMKQENTATPYDPATVEDQDEENGRLARRAESILTEQAGEEDTFYKDPEVLSRLGNEFTQIPRICAEIIKLYYYANASMEEIAEETGLKNAQTAKSKKSQCMKGLIQRVTDSLRSAGISNIPLKRNRKIT